MIVAYSPVLVSRALLQNVPDKWYLEIARPDFAPAGWVFAVVWSILYFLIGLSLFMYCIAPGDVSQKRTGFIFFGIQLILNASFMPICFGLRSFLGGLLVCIFLAVFLAVTIFYFYKVSKIAAYLLLPYFLWGLFAIVLSYNIYLLNY